MINRRNRIKLTIFTGLMLFIASGMSSAYAQSTAEFSGTWNTVTSKGKKITLTLKSTDRRINVTGSYGINGLTGSYKSFDRSDNVFVKVSLRVSDPEMQSLSSISGTVTDNVLRFTWREDGGRGAGRFTMSSDGESFEGTFSKTGNPDDTSGGTWNGMRAPNFAGVWQTKLGEQLQFPQLLLQQTGSQVSGQLFAGRPEMGFIKEGIIDGNTLRFQVWRPRPFNGRNQPDDYVGTGELVMDKGSKSFKGTILGAPASGTRLGR